MRVPRSLPAIIAAFAFSLLASSLPADAQQVGKVHRIGYLTAGGGVEQSFRDAMRQLGYLEGQNIVIEGRFAERKLERLPDLAADLVRLKEAAPTIRRVATIHNLSIAPEARGWAEMQDAARTLSLTLLSKDVRTADDFDSAFAAIARERADALIVLPNSLNVTHTKRIVDFATQHRLPTMFGDGNAVKAGGFMSYWTNWGDLRRRAAIYIDKILKGAKPAELPVEEPTKFELVVNLKTAKALGITIPQTVLIRADEVIQ